VIADALPDCYQPRWAHCCAIPCNANVWRGRARTYVEQCWSERAFVRRIVELYQAVVQGEFDKIAAAGA